VIRFAPVSAEGPPGGGAPCGPGGGTVVGGTVVGGAVVGGAVVGGGEVVGGAAMTVMVALSVLLAGSGSVLLCVAVAVSVSFVAAEAVLGTEPRNRIVTFAPTARFPIAQVALLPVKVQDGGSRGLVTSAGRSFFSTTAVAVSGPWLVTVTV